MKKIILKFIIIAIIVFLGMIAFSSSSKAYAEFSNVSNITNSSNYQFRIGNYYFESFAEVENLQYLYGNVTNPVLEVLQPEVVVNALGWNDFYITSLTITTAISRGDADPYKSLSGTKAVMKRGAGIADKNLFKFQGQQGDYRFENIILDGGWEENHTGIEATQAIIKMEGANTLRVELGNGCIIQNNCSTSTDTENSGGGISCKTGTLVCEPGSVIRNCCAASGGAIYVNNGAIESDGLTIDQCYSTGTQPGKQGVVGNSPAIEFCGYAGNFTCKGITITNCIALNAEEGGGAINMQKGVLDFLPSENGSTINISNNYSTGTAAGILQYTENVYSSNISNINIGTDLTINNNYAGCTVSGYTVTSTGKQANLCLDKHSTVYITDDVTSATNVGVTAINQHIIDQTGERLEPTDHTKTVIFANADNDIAGLQYFHSDVTGAVGQSDGNGHAIFGEGSIPPTPSGDEYSTITIKHEDKGNLVDNAIVHSYRISYVKDGESMTEDFELTDGSDKSFEIDKDSEYTIINMDSLSGGSWTINYSMPEGNTTNPTINIANKSASGTIDVKDAEGIITYTYTKESAPETGINSNVGVILIFIGMVLIMVIAVNKLNKKI